MNITTSQQDVVMPEDVQNAESVTLEIRTSHLTQTQARSLYLSHLLSTWNARTYEFAAV